MSRRPSDIMQEHFTLVGHQDGGWAVPGGFRVTCSVKAREMALEFDNQLRVTLEARKAASRRARR